MEPVAAKVGPALNRGPDPSRSACLDGPALLCERVFSYGQYISTDLFKSTILFTEGKTRELRSQMLSPVLPQATGRTDIEGGHFGMSGPKKAESLGVTFVNATPADRARFSTLSFSPNVKTCAHHRSRSKVSCEVCAFISTGFICREPRCILMVCVFGWRPGQARARGRPIESLAPGRGSQGNDADLDAFDPFAGLGVSDIRPLASRSAW